jgi:hypothetical protein
MRRTKINRNSKLYHFLDRVLEEVLACRRDEIISAAQLQEEYHTLTGRWIDPWEITEMARLIIQTECPLLDFKFV